MFSSSQAAPWMLWVPLFHTVVHDEHNMSSDAAVPPLAAPDAGFASLAELRHTIKSELRRASATMLSPRGGGGDANEHSASGTMNNSRSGSNLSPSVLGDGVGAECKVQFQRMRTGFAEVAAACDRIVRERAQLAHELAAFGVLPAATAEAIASTAGSPTSARGAKDARSLDEVYAKLDEHLVSAQRWVAEPIRAAASTLCEQSYTAPLLLQRQPPAELIDLWVMFACQWRDQATVAKMFAACSFPTALVPPRATQCAQHLIVSLCASLSTVLVALGMALSSPAPRLLHTECLTATAKLCGALHHGVMLHVVPRLEPAGATAAGAAEFALPAHCVTQPASVSPPPCAAVCDIGAVVAAEVLHAGLATLLHLDIEGLGDDTASSVSLTGTAAPAADAASGVDKLGSFLSALVAQAHVRVAASVNKLFQFFVLPDVAAGKWQMQTPFFSDRTCTHAVRFTLLHLHLHWLQPLVELVLDTLCQPPAEDGSAPARHAFIDPRAITVRVMAAATAAAVDEWLAVYAMLKASYHRTAQLRTDVLYLVRGIRELRAAYRYADEDPFAALSLADPAAFAPPALPPGATLSEPLADSIDRALLQLVAVVGLRTAPLLPTAAHVATMCGAQLPLSEDGAATLAEETRSGIAASGAGSEGFWGRVWDVAARDVFPTSSRRRNGTSTPRSARSGSRQSSFTGTSLRMSQNESAAPNDRSTSGGGASVAHVLDASDRSAPGLAAGHVPSWLEALLDASPLSVFSPCSAAAHNGIKHAVLSKTPLPLPWCELPPRVAAALAGVYPTMRASAGGKPPSLLALLRGAPGDLVPVQPEAAADYAALASYKLGTGASVPVQLALRWESWATYPLLEDDEAAAAAVLKQAATMQ